MQRRPVSSVLVGVVAALLLLAVVVGLVAIVGGPGALNSKASSPDRLLLVLASRSDDGSLLAEMIAEVNLDSDVPIVTLIDPDMRATVPGTSYNRLADAFPFGGGGGVARAYAREQGQDALPYIALPPAVWQKAVDDGGGAEVAIPEAANAYTGTQLVMLEPGIRKLSGDEVAALISSAPYMSGEETASALKMAVAEGVLAALGEDAKSTADALSNDKAESSLPKRALETFAKRLAKGLIAAQIVPAK